MSVLLLLLSILSYHIAGAAAHDGATLPFQLDLHTFDPQIEQEYKLHVYHRLTKLSQRRPNYAVRSMYQELITTSLNQLFAQQELRDKARSLYTTIQAYPDVADYFNQAFLASQHKDASETWKLFRTTAYAHLRKLHTPELPPLHLYTKDSFPPEHIHAYKVWLIVYFAIKQNEYMREN